MEGGQWRSVLSMMNVVKLVAVMWLQKRIPSFLSQQSSSCLLVSGPGVVEGEGTQLLGKYLKLILSI